MAPLEHDRGTASEGGLAEALTLGIFSGHKGAKKQMNARALGSENLPMTYEQKLSEAVDAVKREGRYRVFADVKRRRGAFPKADVVQGEAAKPITVWCSNDYLGMGQHPKVLAAMHEAIDLVGAGSGGTRNIAGTTHYHVELEYELADLHGKEAALLFTSAFVANEAALSTLAEALAGMRHLLG